MELQVDVDEADVGQVRVGPGGDVHRRRLPRPRSSRRHHRVGYARRPSDGVVSYTTVLAVDNHDLALRPGMTGTANIAVDERQDVRVVVPNAALRFTPPQQATGQRGLSSEAHADRPAHGRARRRPGGRRPPAGKCGSCDDAPGPIAIADGATDGRLTEVVGGDVQPGLEALTDTLQAANERALAEAAGGDHRGGGAALIELRGVTKTYGSRRRRGSRAARHRPAHRRRRVRRGHGAERLGQVDVHEHPRLPRRARRAGAYRFQRRRRRAAVAATSARCCAAGLPRLRLPGLQPAGPHHGARERRAAAASTAACGRASGAQRALRRARRRSASPAGSTTPRASSPAASSSASPSRARSSPSRRCCSPTSRPATSTPRAALEIMELLDRAQPRRGHHHRHGHARADMAAYARRGRRTSATGSWQSTSAGAAGRLMLLGTTLLPRARARSGATCCARPHHARHRHRRRGGDHDGDARQRGDRGRCAEQIPSLGQQPPAAFARASGCGRGRRAARRHGVRRRATPRPSREQVAGIARSRPSASPAHCSCVNGARTGRRP